MTFTGKASLAGVIGYPVGHSLSPRLHQFWLHKYGIDGAYIPMQVHPDNLSKAVRSLPLLGFQGCNVTLPHKERVMNDMDDVTAAARRAGAVNTIVIDNKGRLIGDNTDGIGFWQDFMFHMQQWDPAPVLLLGAGGAARAIAAALLDIGKIPELRIANRTLWRAEQLAQELGGPIEVVDWAEREKACRDIGLLVNATYLGQAGQGALDMSLDFLPLTASVYDIVYVPWETPLIREAKKNGNIAMNGLGMLLHQAKSGFAAWFGTEPKVDHALTAHMLEALNHELRDGVG